MVVADHEPASDNKGNLDNTKDEESDHSSETKAKADSGPPTELERLKLFTQKVARSAVKSFCETYVYPLILQNPSLAPSKSATTEVINHNQEGQISVPLYPTSENEDQAITLLNPKQGKEENQTESANNPRQDNEKQNRQIGLILNAKEDSEQTTATIMNSNKDEQTAGVQEPKMKTNPESQDVFDIGGILSRLHKVSLAASNLEEEPTEPPDLYN